ncbi:MAG: hypothetical protein LBK58_13565 [Prevotellaceae bacterium]|jgi:hypothetical protein|nr:hypothetical protein [Prevotellaceae bacterium]
MRNFITGFKDDHFRRKNRQSVAGRKTASCRTSTGEIRGVGFSAAYRGEKSDASDISVAVHTKCYIFSIKLKWKDYETI